MNREVIINKVKPFVNSKNSITKSTFKSIFKDFSDLDLIEIINILQESCIFVDISEAIKA